ncbi:TonB-dependent hemoglobin/transferrin/lactoferrin family receptor [Pseudohongiella sp.]|uniref:TonB-dependent receptor plug domain-containing protein n=1 Tax=marine sediment metagenome TaxID=412755 RepID=A0A0F9YJY9_9ZZZZ|nr:TonB-dependent hemoglobin/transferrin/lactoferrin family receptor [Pseudohongiella sp.]
MPNIIAFNSPTLSPQAGKRRTLSILIPALTLLGVAPLSAQTDTAAVDEVIVTATYLQRRPQDIAGTVSVITDEEIQQTLSDNLADVIRYQPGLGMDSAARGGNEGFSIRGIGGNRVLTVIDGVRSSDMYAAGPSSYGKDSFEVDDLKAVEVIRGPASVLYGADALGGVVSLRTRDAADYLAPDQHIHTDIRAAGSSETSQRKLGATIAGQSGPVGSVLQLTQRNFAEQDINGPGKLNPQDGESRNLFWKTRWDASPNQTFSLAIDLSDRDIDTQLDNELSSSVSRSVGQDSTRRHRISLLHDWVLHSALADNISTRLHRQRTDADQQTEQTRISYAFVNPRNPASFRGSQADRFTSLEFNQDTVSGMIIASKNLSLASATHSLVYGLSYEHTDTERPRDRFDTELSTGAISRAIASYPMAPPEVFPNKTFPDTRTVRNGIFIQDEISLMDENLIVVPGLRYDRYQMDPRKDELFTGTGDISDWGGFSISKFDEDNISYNLGAIYRITDSLTAFAQYAEGFRPPNFDEANQAFVNLGHGYATVPNPDLEAETSQGMELGFRGTSDAGRFSVAVFDNRYDDFIESELVGMQDGIMLFQDNNVGKARIYGAEATYDWQLSSQLSWRNSVAWARGRDESNNSELNSVDPATLVSGLRYQPSERWAIEGIATVVSGKSRVAADDQVTGDAYQLLDLIGHYDLSPSASIRFGLFNLFDTQYAHWSRIRGLSADDNDAIADRQAPGTNARLAFNFSF